PDSNLWLSFSTVMLLLPCIVFLQENLWDAVVFLGVLDEYLPTIVWDALVITGSPFVAGRVFSHVQFFLVKFVSA
ncbi:hypothetical protein ACNSPB_00070, partial [Yersinia enterocolitica]